MPTPYVFTVTVASEENENVEQMQLMLDFIFNGCISIMMFLCFFSLSASMSANLYEQTREIGVLRSIGITSFQICRVYFYEAFIVVESASILGMLTGSTIGYTMTLQQAQFTNISLNFIFPWHQFWYIMLLALIFALFATVGPTTQLAKKEIAAIFRIN